MEINYLAVIGAGVVGMVIGAIWYSPGVFGKTWMRLSGMSMKDMEETKKSGGMWKYYLAGLVSQLVMAWVLAYLLAATSASSLVMALQFAFWTWLGFVATVTFGGVLWEHKPLKLFGLNNAYYLLSLLIMSGILFTWK